MSEKRPLPSYSFDVLNNREGQFRVTARTIDASESNMINIRNKLEINSPGLCMHIGTWIPAIQAYTPTLGEEFTQAATRGYNHGALMTYELLDRVAKANGQNLPNPRFDPSNVADTEMPDGPPHHNLLGGSMRGYLLPEKFPVIFKSAMTMLGRMFNQPPSFIEKRVYGLPSTDDDVYIAHFLTGVVEVVLPLERYSESDRLEQLFKPQ